PDRGGGPGLRRRTGVGGQGGRRPGLAAGRAVARARPHPGGGGHPHAARRRRRRHRRRRGRHPGGAGGRRLPGRRRRHRQGLRRRAPGHLTGRRSPGAGHQRRGGAPRLRDAEAAADARHVGRRRRGPPGRGPVSRGQHGPQGPGRRAVPPPRRRRGRDHHPGAGLRLAGGHGVGARGPAGDADRAGPAGDHRLVGGHPRRRRVGRAGSDGMTARIVVQKDRYVDSVVQMGASRAMMDVDGVEWAAAAMGTPANLDTLAGKGFDLTGVDATANDCFLAVLAGSDAAAGRALAAGEAALAGPERRGTGAGAGPAGAAGPERPRSLGEAVDALGGEANLAIVSVPGDYAALEAHKALSAGMHVLLFSDNVPLDQEVELKQRAEALGRLVMGPDAGTAMLGRTGLGFANVVGAGGGGDGASGGDDRPGVGVVAAAGTGAQEVMALLDRGGARVTAVIGVGGRDLSETVGGRMARSGLRALREDAGTDAVLLVSTPPSDEVAKVVLAEAGAKPAVAALIGLAEPVPTPEGVRLASTLEGGATTMLARLGLPPLDLDGGLRAAVTDAVAALPAGRTLVRGLFSGGTLCYEALVILAGILG